MYEAVNLGLLSTALFYAKQVYAKYPGHVLDSWLLRKRRELDFSVEAFSVADTRRRLPAATKRQVVSDLGGALDDNKEELAVDFEDI